MNHGVAIKLASTGILAGGMLISMTGLALANTNYKDSGLAQSTVLLNTKTSETRTIAVSTGQKIQVNGILSGGPTIMKQALDKLVSGGTITQEQENAVLASIPKNISNVTKPSPDSQTPDLVQGTVTSTTSPQNLVVVKIDPLGDLVTNGTLTSAQAQAIENTMSDIIRQQMEQSWQDDLKPLVTQGTITQNQADQILTFLSANTPIAQKDPLSQMVTQGIINQTQADNLREQNLLGNINPGGQDIMQEALNGQVTAGTLSQDQANAILSATQQAPNIESLKPTPNVTSGQASAFLLVDPLENLVKEGTITDIQAQAVKNSLNDLINQQAESQWQKVLTALVTEGGITQDQADKILAFLSAHAQPIPKDIISRMLDQGIVDQAQAEALRQLNMSGIGPNMKADNIGFGVKITTAASKDN
ncbi:hypothetical protein REC12_01195 [Desulfosporosinus sp. PR]|uniref:hypothetical protein n=1 Tax=Candidatus Desulfosporosinus nitrosoreducens TaxID=3401928 RepID=UPI0027F5C933|nr:hypothetical protein [Desulfosporosinus sp. PR]MDQ7092205.1 hypothetical protein [Desulfosporosinus sp. PR]